MHDFGTLVVCADCHGGDPTSAIVATAHVCPPPEVGSRAAQVLNPSSFFLRTSLTGIDKLSDYDCNTNGGGTQTVSALDWLGFINPGDLRVARSGRGCGACHEDETDAVALSTMGQTPGLFRGARHGSGTENVFPDRDTGPTADFGTLADYAASDTLNADYNVADRRRGEVPSVAEPPVIMGAAFQDNATFNAGVVDNSRNLFDTGADNYPNGMFNSVAASLLQDSLNQACNTCHVQGGTVNDSAGRYRSTGCSSCHVSTATIARAGSADPNVDKFEPLDPNNLTPGEHTHRISHTMKSAADVGLGQAGIDNTGCLVCHQDSAMTVASYEGYRLDENQDLVNNNFYPSNNTVTFNLKADLFGDNALYLGESINAWVQTEIWQSDITNILGQDGQDETPADIHHEGGMVCIDCHGLATVHGRGERLYGDMKAATHFEGVTCETCHGTADAYAVTDGTSPLDNADTPLSHIIDGGSNNLWLASKGDGSLHYITQVRDLVDASGGPFGKVYPPGTPRQGQPIFDPVASYAMGRFETANNLANGYGPAQPSNGGALNVSEGFSHLGETDGGGGMECVSCHAAWQPSCIGCHLEATYNDEETSYFYSRVTGERIYANVSTSVRAQNPITFLLGINSRGRIAPFLSTATFFRFTDRDGTSSSRVAWSDRNGLGRDPALRNVQRNNLPALNHAPTAPHTVRGRYTATDIGGRGCLDCHEPNDTTLMMHDQSGNAWDLTSVVQNSYADAITLNVQTLAGEGSNLWLIDSGGELVFNTNNTPVFDLDRLLEPTTAVTNTSGSHALLDIGSTDPDHLQFADTNSAQVTRPLTSAVLNRLETINTVGLTDVYYYNDVVGTDPNNSGNYARFLTDYNLFGQ